MPLRTSTSRLLARLLSTLPLLPFAACGSTAVTTTTDACENPVEDGNLVHCDGGFSHRPRKDACAQPASGACTLPANPDEPAECAVDADCTAQPYGRCVELGDPNWGSEYCGCSYGCATDADCTSGEVCICGARGGTCTTASCGTDADCGPEALCATAQVGTGECESTVWACQTAADECASSADCVGGNECLFNGTKRSCTTDECGIGRPFLVHGEERLAPATARADWIAAGATPFVADLDAASRERLAARWTAVGAMEHAAVAAFARFVLQLLSLGAPPDLVREAQGALADETRHAEACYAFASAYAGAPIGPGPLPIDGALAESDARSILVTAILEGCVGETVAALEAAETAERAEDPVVREALQVIADDEARHAELAYRFVRWALSARPELVADARAAFDEALATPPRAIGARDDDAAGERHGFAGEGLRREIRRRALAEVIAPSARALLAGAIDRRPQREPIAAVC